MTFTSSNTIENLPLQELTRAIFQRLDGNIFKLDGTTPIPVYDAFPDTLAERWDYVEIAGFELEPEPSSGRTGAFAYVGVLNIVSSYNGQRELEGAVQQVNRYLNSKLSLTGFTDLGSNFRRVQAEKLAVEENRVYRRATYRRRWVISDHKF